LSENALGMVLGMLGIAASWSVALAACAGLGLGLLRCLRLERGGSENLFAAIWIGWAIGLGALQLWHLFRPVDVWARTLLLFIAAAGLTRNLRPVLAELRPAMRRVLPFAGAAVLLALWLANRAMAPEMASDAGLYHLPTVRWLLKYPIVPGLGNLNWRLAFNSSFFLFMAAMDLGAWAHRYHHVAIYFLVLTLGLQIGWSAYLMFLGRRAVSFRDLLRVALIPAVARKMWTGIHEGEPDLAMWILGVVLVDQLLRLVEDRHRGKATTAGVLVVFLVGCAALSVRLSVGMMALAAMVAALALHLRTKDRAARTPPGALPVVMAVFLSGLVIALWVLRGYLLSGYPVFPSTAGGISVDWRVPRAVAIEEARWIMSWARSPGESPDIVLKDWAWLAPWLNRLRADGNLGTWSWQALRRYRCCRLYSGS